MNQVDSFNRQIATWESAIPTPVRAILRGVGQVIFQENALTGACFLVGIAVSSPQMALGALVGSVIGTAMAWALKFDGAETQGGIFGFNATLVGIATLFFFQPGLATGGMLIVGCVAATILTWLMRRYVPFPTYTTPFVVVTWGIFVLGPLLGAIRVAGGGSIGVGIVESIAHGIGQIMFQASIASGVLFLLGLAVSEWRHAAWVLFGSVLGMIVGHYHASAGSVALDPERLVERAVTENIALGLYGYNATLAAVALFLWRRSLIAPFLGSLLAVLITELIPPLGLPALTAPFVLATWVVLAIGYVETRWLRAASEAPG
jgi:urea transporter